MEDFIKTTEEEATPEAQSESPVQYQEKEPEQAGSFEPVQQAKAEPEKRKDVEISFTNGKSGIDAADLRSIHRSSKD